MDFKQKLSDIFHPSFPSSLNAQRSEERVPSELSKLLSDNVIFRTENAKRNSISSYSVTNDDVLLSIDERFYDESFNASLHELKELGDVRLKELIQVEKQKLLNQLTVISKKVFSVVLERQADYNQEFNRILELQDELDSALGFCTSSRLQTASAKKSIAAAGLELVYKYRKKKQLMSLLQSLEQETELHIQAQISKGDFAEAIHLLAECQKVLQPFSHFTCVAQLNLKLQDTLIMAEEMLDNALAKVCENFNTSQYERIQEAYESLGKSHVALDQLFMHMTTAIHTAALSVVSGYVVLYGSSIDVNKVTFSELCKKAVPESCVPCLLDLCRSMWTLMFNFNRVINWHLSNNILGNIALNDHQSDDIPTPDDRKTSKSIDDTSYTEQKLNYGKSRVWQDIQTKLKDFLLSVDVSAFRIEELLSILDIIRRLIEVGKEFSGSQSESLQDCLRQQTISYFKNYHFSRFDELKAFLDNESWEPCPVSESFSCKRLAEFQFLEDVFYTRTDSSENDNGIAISYFKEHSEEYTPFDTLKSPQDSSFYDKCGSVKLEDGLDHTEDNPFSVKKVVLPTLSNTALSLLRLIGRYLQMMRLLQPIAFDICICLNQLIDYYLYAVAKFFTFEVKDSSSIIPNSKLPAVLEKIESDLILNDDQPMAHEEKLKVLAPSLSRIVNLSRPESMVARITAVESVVFLAQQLENFSDEFKAATSESKHAALDSFFQKVKTNAVDLRHPVFACIARLVIKRDLVLAQMNRVQWDIREVMSQHSPYVDELLIELQSFSTRLGETLSRVSVSPEVHTLIWEHVALYANQTLLEGYSNVKKCTNEGRALMQLDFRHFTMKMETLTSVRPLPGSTLVETYIKAFYIPESTIEEWTKEHTEYSEKQLQSLVQVVSQSNKRRILKFPMLEERKL
ncbi:syndetin-like isoform X2 [Artemia franciscana]|uniref:syndetin-like isoform X2 n=1 Tax=Artemia franciscana TaxID=6661 RepID=UPI0032DB72FC